MRRCLSLFFFQLISVTLDAQFVDSQAWYEYIVNYPFAKNYNIENSITYSTLVNSSVWRAYDYSVCVERSVTPHLDLLAQSVFSYTNQTNTSNTFEVRPTFGGRLHLTPSSRLQTRLLLRVEYRNFKNLDTEEWERVIRPRARAEFIFPINRKSYSSDNMWYAISDVEYLYNIFDVNERFANRFRVRIGGGYRLSYNLRFEFLYMIQRSRDFIGGNFETTDNVFRFRIKHFLRKARSSTLNGTGN